MKLYNDHRDPSDGKAYDGCLFDLSNRDGCLGYRNIQLRTGGLRTFKGSNEPWLKTAHALRGTRADQSRAISEPSSVMDRPPVLNREICVKINPASEICSWATRNQTLSVRYRFRRMSAL